MKEAVSLDVTFKNTDEEDEKYIDRLTYYGMMDDDTESNSILSRARTIAEVRLFVATLPQDEREFCETLMHNTKAETGRILSKGRPTMWRMIKRIRNKMIDAGFDCSQQKKYKKNPKGV